MDYIAVAIAPGVAFCLYIFYKDIYNREPGVNLIISFALGAFTILPAIGIERSLMGGLIDGSVIAVAVLSFLVIALTEESCKFAALRLYSYNQKSFDEPLDGIVYSLMISMGFATAENIKYVIEHQQAAGTGLQIGLYRMFTAVPAHATFAVVMGYFVGKAKADPANSVVLMLTGLGAAVIIHGTYDFL
jgi:RsiW-degrading membrane proteinase PrsW (M82 family)